MLAPKNKKTRIQHFLEKNPYCIFCGGQTPASTEDHVPPKTLFWFKKCPEGYNFGACLKCNNSSSDEDFLIGVLVKMGVGSITEGQMLVINDQIKKFQERRPDISRSMMFTGSEKKRKAKEMNIHPPAGALYNDLPIFKLPPNFNSSMEIFAAKITKALHFKHTRVIVPKTASILFIWQTNANVLKGEYLMDSVISNELISAPALIREKHLLDDQFSYKYQISQEKDISMFYCIFGKSISFLTYVFFDPQIADEMHNNVRILSPGAELKMREINRKTE